MDREPSTLDPAELSNLVQQLAQQMVLICTMKNTQINTFASALHTTKNTQTNTFASALHIGVATMAQGFPCDENASAPSMCNPACDCHPWPGLQSLNQLRLLVEVVLRPHRFLLVHGVYDDCQDKRIEFLRCEIGLADGRATGEHIAT